MTRFELVTSSLPRKRSTPELHRLFNEHNEKPEYFHFFQKEIRLIITVMLKIQPQNFHFEVSSFERETGFEPATFSLEG